MFTIHRKEIEWGGRTLVIETGRVARQADGSAFVTYGDTTVHATAVYQRAPKPGQDFFPLTVNYQEKYYAAGKIPGGFFKREGRPTEKETLVSRLIDRPIRPLFVPGFKNEVQVVVNVLSHDLENDPDIVAMIAASAALTLSGVPFMGPIGAARVGFIDGNYVLNPAVEDVEKSRLDLVVAGTADAVMMVESEVKELTEDEMLGAVMFAHRSMQPVIDMIIALAEQAAKDPFEFKADDQSELIAKAKAVIGTALAEAYSEPQKLVRQDKVSAVKKNLIEKLSAEGYEEAKVGGIFKTLEADVVRWQILDHGKRIDGRDKVTVRPIVAEVGVLPRTHGSALFTRGETQALVVTTLGTGDDEQLIDALTGTYYERFMLHYNFPPFSVGETGRMGGAGRREIGHGKLAWRAMKAVLPENEKFPYTLRVVSEIMESNGSSSMATVCGASLSMMDAGVPLTRPVAGIAMGLIKEGDKFAVISDILGDEDHLGDMDFKVAGTDAGITSLQMDIKVAGITEEIMRVALAQAKQGRMHILGEMAKALTGARTEMSSFAPRIETMTVPRDKIREVIGSGGKVIQDIVAQSGAKVNIEDDGTVNIAAADPKAIEKAMAMIKSIVAEPEVGAVYEGKVVKIMEFGAFVNFLGKKDGLVHISELVWGRPAKVTDVVQEGDIVKVKFLGMDDRGKVRLSMKALQEKPEGWVDRPEREREDRPRPPRDRDGGGRDRDRGDRGPRRERSGGEEASEG